MFNANQARYVRAVLGGLRKHLDHIESVVENRHPDEGDYRWDLSPEDVASYRLAIAGLRGLIDEIISEFAIPPVESRFSGNWAITTSLDFAEVDLEELTFRKLTGYGPGMDKEFYDRFDERIREVRQRLHQAVRFRPDT